MSMMDVRRRPAWVGWVPAGVLVLLMIAAAIVTTVILQSGYDKPPPPPTVDQVTGADLSLFTEEGRAYIERSRDIRLDLSDGPVDAAALGLPVEGTTVIGPHAADLPYDIQIYGGGEAPGGIGVARPTLTIETFDGDVTLVTIPTAGSPSFPELLGALEAQASIYGWEPVDRDAVTEALGDAVRSGESYSFTIAPGDRVGLAVGARVDCSSTGACGVEFEVAPAIG